MSALLTANPTIFVMIPWLSPYNNRFPSPHEALDEPDGLLAAGGDLSIERLISAYRHGIFPWFSDEDPILWWSPNPRCVLKPRDIHISRSMRKAIRKQHYCITFDQAFSEVIELCSSSRDRVGNTWITDEMKHAYTALHQQGIAHSLEVWRDGTLVGGLYGLAIGKLFFGESMFSLEVNTSKVAYIALAKQLGHWRYALIDCQVQNDHLNSLGASEISRAEFLEYIKLNIDEDPGHEWQFELSNEQLIQTDD